MSLVNNECMNILNFQVLAVRYRFVSLVTPLWVDPKMFFDSYEEDPSISSHYLFIVPIIKDPHKIYLHLYSIENTQCLDIL